MAMRGGLSWAGLWFYAITGVCVLLLLALPLVDELSHLPRPLGRLGRLDLAAENNAAVWWSGMLLLLVGLHCFDGYPRLRGQLPAAARAWAALCVTMVVLSADEVGSIHERTSDFLPGGVWLPRLPFALVLLGLVGYSVVALWRTRDERHQVLWIAAGFLLFATVALQEWIEHRVEWSDRARPWRTMIEEGTEFAGMVVLLRAAMTNTQGRLGRRDAAPSPVFELVRMFRIPILIAALLAAPFLAYGTSLLTDVRGQPADWLAASLFLLAGLAGIRPLLQGRGADTRELTLAALCVVASIGAVDLSETRTATIASFEISRKLLLLFALSSGMGALWALRPGYPARLWVPASIAIAALALSAPLQPSWFLMFCVPQYLGLAAYFVNASAQSADRADLG